MLKQQNWHDVLLAVHASVPSNTFAIYGNGEDKELTELVPGILNQLGPDSLASLRKLAESYQSMQKKEAAEGGDNNKKDDDDDDDIPDLVAGENFESKVEWEGESESESKSETKGEGDGCVDLEKKKPMGWVVVESSLIKCVPWWNGFSIFIFIIITMEREPERVSTMGNISGG